MLFGAGLAGGIVTAVVGGIADLERLPRWNRSFVGLIAVCVAGSVAGAVLLAALTPGRQGAADVTSRSWSALRISAMPACAHTSKKGESSSVPISRPPRALA